MRLIFMLSLATSKWWRVMTLDHVSRIRADTSCLTIGEGAVETKQPDEANGAAANSARALATLISNSLHRPADLQ